MNTKSLTIKVAFPIFEYASQVTHFTPRTPTVIERMILRLVHDYRNEPTIGSTALLNISGSTSKALLEGIFLFLFSSAFLPTL